MPNFFARHSSFKQAVLKQFCVALAVMTAYSSSAQGFNVLILAANENVQKFGRLPATGFTDKPTKVKVGNRPGRDPINRGGLWNANSLKALRNSRLKEISDSPNSDDAIFASHSPLSAMTFAQALPGDGGGAGTLPGEGGTGGSGVRGSLNTNTGNLHREFPIIGWSTNSRLGIDFNLHHNSSGVYAFDLGKGWSHSYDMKVDVPSPFMTGSIAILRLPDGLELPFEYKSGAHWSFNGSTYTHNSTGSHWAPPAEFPGLILRNNSGTYELHDISSREDVTVYTFSTGLTGGCLTQIKDEHANFVSIVRGTGEKITSVQDNLGRSLTFTYDNSGRIAAVHAPLGKTWNFNYDYQGNLVEIQYPALNSSVHSRLFTFNSTGDMLTETDLNSNLHTWTYDSSSKVLSYKDPANFTWNASYGTSAVTYTNPLGGTVVHNYSSGRVVSEVDEAGFSESYTYSTSGKVTQLTDKRGNVWTATYHPTLDRVATSTNPLGQTTTYTYNSNGFLTSVTDPLGNATAISRDSKGSALSATDPLGRLIFQASYAGNGQLSTVSDALNRAVSAVYGSTGSLSSVTDPAGLVNSSTVDALGRPTSTTSPDGQVLTPTYDSWSRVVSLSKNSGATTTIAYDLEGNVLSATDPLGRTSTSIYNNRGLVSSSTNAKNETTTYTYDALGRVTASTNARGKTTNFVYNARSETSSVTLPDGSLESWAYDASGNTTAFTNGANETILYVYDSADQVTKIDYPTGIDTTATYDASGRQVTMTDSTGTSTWSFNSAGEVTQLVTPQGTTQYAYNLAGQQTSMTEPGIGTTTYAYDPYGRPTGTTDAFGDVTSFLYDSAGRVSRRNLPNGTYEQFVYDSQSRVTSIILKDSANAVLKNHSYTFDSASQVLSETIGSITTSYGYDNIGQLVSEAKSSGYSATYSYDANGNRLTRTVNGVTDTYSYDNGDKLLSVSGGNDPRTFSYDGAGRTIGIHRASGTTAFSYDYESRVTQITKPGMTNNSFTYNGLDTRVGMSDSSGSKVFKRNGIGVTAPVLSDGTAQFTPSGEVRGGTKTTFHSGMKNSTTQTSSAGVVSAEKSYDAFGNVVSASGVWKSQFGYAGKFGYQSDPDTGLKLLGHRYYDSDTGRFLTRDPIKDGRNWYSYCDNNPVSGIDSTGLYRVVVIGDTSGVPGGGWLGGVVVGNQDGDIVFRGKNMSKDAILAAMIDADEFIFYGHGTIYGELILGNGEYITHEDLMYVYVMRLLLGKGKMKIAEVRSCFSCNSAESVNMWLGIASVVKGFPDLTGEMFPPRLNPIQTWKSPIKRNPGVQNASLDGVTKEPTFGRKKGRKSSGKGKGVKDGI